VVTVETRSPSGPESTILGPAMLEIPLILSKKPGAAMRKGTETLNTASIIQSILKRIVYPRHFWSGIMHQRAMAHTARVYDDSQLSLYAEILPGDFLNLGHFEDPGLQPQDITLRDIVRAQARHAELVAELIADSTSPVLDVGCGMGGLIRVMLAKGLSPVALSPDRNQIRHVRAKYPTVTIVETKFEDIPLDEHIHRYGTIITSESLRYLKLDRALPLMEKLLKPGGRWIACDSFRVGEERGRSGYVWADFERRMVRSDWRFVCQRDHTPNVVPTLRFVYMWGNDIARPGVRFAFRKLQRKHPRAYYILEEVIEAINGRLDQNLDLVNPDAFVAHNKYMLLAMEKTS